MGNLIEIWRSREGTESDDPGSMLIFTGTEFSDEAVLRAAIASNTPATFRGLKRRDWNWRPLGGSNWEVEVRYGAWPTLGDSVFNFETGGGTRKVQQSLTTISRTPGTAPDCQGAIGVNGDSIEGVDVPDAQYSFSETHYLPDSIVTPAYKVALYRCTGKTNAAAFKGFNAGEVLFLGATGSKRGLEAWEISFKFLAGEDVTNLAVGPFTIAAKAGHDYLWFMFADHEDAGRLIKRPVAAYVERVFQRADFSQLGIGV